MPLILTRRENESILIGDGIRVTIVNAKNKRAKVSIDAPDDIKIKRGELTDGGTDAQQDAPGTDSQHGGDYSDSDNAIKEQTL